LKLKSTKFTNPQGLNLILSEVLGYSVEGDWDKDVPTTKHVGAIKKEEAQKQLKGRIPQVWGDMLHQHAFSYINQKLQGWTVLFCAKIKGKEYDCIGWEGKRRDITDLDLAIEMTFLSPEVRNEVKFIQDKTNEMAQKLDIINAKRKYILIGVPPNRKITVRYHFPYQNIKVAFQEHKFGKQKIEKRLKR